VKLWISCTGKVRHATQHDAKKAVRNMGRRNLKGAVKVYRCRRCGGWHVGGVLRPVPARPARRAHRELEDMA
jgi:hypothetical protein